jgi:hypothetical protein
MGAWDAALERLAVLRALDRQCVAFGASVHRYQFAGAIGEGSIAAVEAQLGRPFPPQLRAFYREVGNGGAGPDHGMRRAQQVTAARADSLCVIDMGPGPETHVSTAPGSLDRVLHVEEDGEVADTGVTLVEYYAQWIEREVSAFEAVRAWIDEGLSMAQIADSLVASHRRWDGRELAISLMDVARPEALFGTAESPRFDGAVQFPWYEAQLRAYRGEAEAATPASAPSSLPPEPASAPAPAEAAKKSWWKKLW